MAPKTRILFRADGNSRIGLGHVVRSLALADMLRQEYECVFAIQNPDEKLQQQIREVCHGLLLLPVCAPQEERFKYELLAYVSAKEIVVLDGYHFDTAYQQNLKKSGCALVCLDDLHAFPFVADAVVNAAGGVAPHKYKTAPYTKLLLGPKYTLLRPPFLAAAKTSRLFPGNDTGLKVLLNMGGADPKNHTLQIAGELVQNKNIAALEIVVGSAYQHLPALEQFIREQPACTLHQNLSAEAMANLMRESPVAVTSASGVACEYAAVGGILYTRQTADNQADLYSFLTGSGSALKYNAALPGLNKENFDRQVAQQRQHFDGKSKERFQELFRNLSLGLGLTLRAVNATDSLLLFNWANDPEVRSRSFNPNPITPENHTRWFTTKLQDKEAKLYIADVNGQPAAHIRFEVRQQTATLSYLLDKEFRGKGLGHLVLQKGVEKLLEELPHLRFVEGLVQQDNIASVRAFEKAGFAYGAPAPAFPLAHRFILEQHP